GGELVNNGDGTYVYTFLTDVTAVDGVTYDANLTHRVAMQFSGPAVNPHYDFVPATGATTGIETRDIVTVENCNSCHDPLALHGGGRIETEYCVTCHNPGTSDPDTGNTVDFKVMVHKIHRGANLPSVQDGGTYQIIGYRSSVHDYSNVHYPQDIRNCTKCHAGTGTDPGDGSVVLTVDGDNWNEVPSRAACGSCHDDVDFTLHMGGQDDDSACLSCHSAGGFVGSIASSHDTPVLDAIPAYEINVIAVTNTAPGQFPVVTFSVTNPLNGDAAYDIVNDLDRLRMGVAWDTDDYNNVGNGGDNARYQVTDAIANAVSNGDGTYTVTSQVQIPDGTTAPFIAASGSGAIIFEGRGLVDVNDDPAVTELDEVPLTFGIGYFSIDEADGEADPRRQVVSIDKCNACHFIKTQHGGNRANDNQGCIGCHNTRLTAKPV
ncbi:MAG: OmcA/MtrC family decaheme c-type cytochrome, partial [Pseudomonadales bacterium]|nr:OmcA/MtrC family decaheme c-type cytochrome [Pseudomonadales bacterium]